MAQMNEVMGGIIENYKPKKKNISTVIQAPKYYQNTVPKANTVNKIIDKRKSITQPKGTMPSSNPFVKNSVITKSVDNGFGAVQDMYEKLLQQQQSQRSENIDASINEIENAKPFYQNQAENNARSSYINKVLSERALNEQLSAQGINGGASETSKIANENRYQNAMNANNKSLQDAYLNLDSQVAKIRTNGNSDLANLQNSYLQNLINAKQQYDQIDKSEARADRDFSFREKQFNAQRAQEKARNDLALKNYQRMLSNRGRAKVAKPQAKSQGLSAQAEQSLYNQFTKQFGDFSGNYTKVLDRNNKVKAETMLQKLIDKGLSVNNVKKLAAKYGIEVR